ncbi:hypothetical protein [Streptomyces fagopyri]|uniref:hypothetical protein n=1 Tax=Streptomyces fagopyri TaxID=2662397 RepID=UPI00371786C6
MIVILGLIILIAAVVVGVAGLLGNAGSSHALASGDFTVLGYHVTGSTGTLFLSGIVVGAVAMLGLGLLLAGSRRSARRAQVARRGLSESHRRNAAISRDRDDLIVQREATRTDTAPTRENGPSRDTPDQGDKPRHRWHHFGHPSHP